MVCNRMFLTWVGLQDGGNEVLRVVRKFHVVGEAVLVAFDSPVRRLDKGERVQGVKYTENKGKKGKKSDRSSC